MSTKIETGLNNKCEIIKKTETDSIKCSNCKKELLIVHQSKIFETPLYSIVVQCPFCNDKSYNYEIKGDVKWVVPERVKLVNTVTSEKDKIVTLQTIKG
jgi:hypothetical protein